MEAERLKSSTGNFGQRNRGFTLLEMLVTLVLIGIILTFAVLSVGNGVAEKVDTESRRLAALMELAAEEAVLQSQDLGIRFEQGGYRFLKFTNGGWQPVEGDRVLRARQLPAEVTLELYLEGLPVSFESEPDQPPQVMLYASGERTPFELVIRPRAESSPSYRLHGPLLGKLTLEGPLN